MQRIYLKQGDTFKLNDKIYTVKSVIGDGATCVVYSAEYKDSLGLSHTVNIKELYPYNASIIRDGSDLIWKFFEEKEIHQDAFITTYEKLLAWQYENEIVGVSDICEANNTRYIIMESSKKCVTFDKDTPESLSDILKTVRLLAYYVGKYHQNGYLHLDIKPSNFLVYPRPSEHIVLFDLDTVTSISDIETGKCRSASYSDGWAAPEQKQGKIYKLCPATDIYAIGAVLFEKIMGRQVNNDDIGYFAEWNFEGELFENVNPKIKRLLANIFKKTLAASVKRRYQNADALIKDLDKAITVSESEVYLKGDDVCCSGYFVGREKEIKLIKAGFDSKKKAVFLHGIGGIGKTEIARKYAELYKKDYDVILFVKYDSNFTLQDKLDEIDIENFDGDISDKRKKLRGLLDDKTLVIIDNFDVEIGIDKTLKSLFETKAHILVSTRTDFLSVYNGDKYTQIEIKELDGNELEQVFFSNAKINNVSESDRAVLNKIFKLIENHTYATELLAKQMYYSGWSLSTLYEKVKSGFASLGNAEKIVTNKDEDVTKDNSLNILRAVFRISDLTEGQKQVLRDMTLLDFIKVTKKVYQTIALSPTPIYKLVNNPEGYKMVEIMTTDDIQNKIPDKTLNSFNELFELGYLQCFEDYFYLHGVIKEIVLIDLKPSLDNCVAIDNYIFKTIEWFDEEYDVTDAAQAEGEHKAIFLSKFFKKLPFCTEIHLISVLHWLEYFYNGLFWSASVFNPRLELLSLFDYLENSAKQIKSDEVLFKTYLTFFKTWLDECSHMHFEDHVDELCKRNVRKYFEVSLNIANRLDEKELKKQVYETVSETIDVALSKGKYSREIYNEVLLSMYNAFGRLPEDIVQKCYTAAPELFESIDISDKLIYNLPVSQEEQRKHQADIDASLNVMKTKTNDEILWDEEYEKIYLGFKNAEDKEFFARQVFESQEYSIEQKLTLFDEFLSLLFGPLYLDKSKQYYQNTDWHKIENVVAMQTELLNGYSKCVSSEMRDEYSCLVRDIRFYKTIISIIFEKDDGYQHLNDMVDEDIFWSKLNDSDFGFRIANISLVCRTIDKNRFALPFMLEEFNRLSGDMPDEDGLDEWASERFFMLSRLSNSARLASEEVEENSDAYNNFVELHQWSQKLLDRATNKEFNFRE